VEPRGLPAGGSVTGQRKSLKILGAIELWRTRFDYRPVSFDYRPVIGGVVLNQDGSLAAVSLGQLFQEPEIADSFAADGITSVEQLCWI
jgi:hypothetical protein